ncbi:hypothetical protein Lfu02_03570 [Longispora fulva]|uniref:Uncharacterized protein n=1 Tax=Longispora fulva TaxID=619741 RepID=A0A8J7GC16_9ACTN|nr:hypothetical protein [Longispora fulva]MBG6135774.1 hypothetical protein [Longispora fulva]GIG55985.1 hypothetical protein Lfu02_03570 [Longispora fulva]
MYPLLHTTDLDAAFDLAQRLVALADRVQEVSVSAVTTPQGLPRYLPLPESAGRPMSTHLRVPAERAEVVSRLFKDLPEDRFSWYPSGTGRVWDLKSTEAELIEAVPDLLVDIDMDAVEPGRVEELFIATVGRDIGELGWSVVWPSAPEEDLWSVPKYDGVELVVHETGWCSEEWSPTHSVWVCGRSEARAAWAARATGRTVVGEMQLGR